MDFNQAFERLRGHEGGFNDDPKDRGNWTSGVIGKGLCKGTKYGVSAAAYPGEDIEHLTLDRARELYRRDYWGPAGCDSVPDSIRFDLFDMAVNSGVKAAIKCLQHTVAETEDGVLGPRTLQALQAMPELRVAARFNGARLLYVTEANAWPAYGRGWARRIALNLMAV